MTKRELMELLAPFNDDIQVEVGLAHTESGMQHAIVDVVYATGSGRCDTGGSCVIIEYADGSIDPNDDVEEEVVLTCPHCGTEF
jgi:hypothetical protein